MFVFLSLNRMISTKPQDQAHQQKLLLQLQAFLIHLQYHHKIKNILVLLHPPLSQLLLRLLILLLQLLLLLLLLLLAILIQQFQSQPQGATH